MDERRIWNNGNYGVEAVRPILQFSAGGAVGIAAIDNALWRLRYSASRERERRIVTRTSLALQACVGLHYTVAIRDNLWRLLATITANKALNLVRDANRQKRGGGAALWPIRPTAIGVVPAAAAAAPSCCTASR